MKINLGFLTNNAGDDIPGSTIKHTISNFYKYFDKVIVVDGNLTTKASSWYNSIPNIEVINNKWTGRHVDQYIERNKACKDGDWLLALDCDEAPSIELASNIRQILSQVPSDITAIRLPVIQYWFKNNSDKCYLVEGRKPKHLDTGCKNNLYKKTKYTFFHHSINGTHVTPYNGEGNIGFLPIPYIHFKSPETIIFNICICIMDELRPSDDPEGINRKINKEHLDELESIGTKYNLLSKEAFRIATKNKAWPKELIEFAKKTKNLDNHLRFFYDLYFVIIGAEKTDKTYEDICNIGDMNITYNKSLVENNYLVVPHTPVLNLDPNLPCGAG